MLNKIALSLPALAATLLLMHAPALGAGDTCGFVRDFDQPDDGGAQIVHVYRGDASANIGGARPFAFVVLNVKVNTDGTRISYAADDPRAKTKAINDIRNAYNNPSRPISDFEAVRDAGWKPLAQVWSVLNSEIIEKDARPGQEGLPCLDGKGFLVSMTAIRATNTGVQGDCEQSKWVDALTVPAFVLPGGSQFGHGGAGLGNVIVGLTIHQPRQLRLASSATLARATRLARRRSR
jgi:hypothetical protein